MDATKLRKAFKYPADEDKDEPVTEGLDEEEQDKIIEDLREWDRKSSKFWKTLLTGLILTIAACYLAMSFYYSRISYHAHSKLIVVFGGFASVFSAVFLHGMPQRLKDKIPHMGATIDSGHFFESVSAAGFVLFDLYTLLVNAFVFLAAIGLPADTRLGVPALLAFVIALLGRFMLKPIGVKELERLRYNYKGA